MALVHSLSAKALLPGLNKIFKASYADVYPQPSLSIVSPDHPVRIMDPQILHNLWVAKFGTSAATAVLQDEDPVDGWPDFWMAATLQLRLHSYVAHQIDTDTWISVKD